MQLIKPLCSHRALVRCVRSTYVTDPLCTRPRVALRQTEESGCFFLYVAVSRCAFCSLGLACLIYIAYPLFSPPSCDVRRGATAARAGKKVWEKEVLLFRFAERLYRNFTWFTFFLPAAVGIFFLLHECHQHTRVSLAVKSSFRRAPVAETKYRSAMFCFVVHKIRQRVSFCEKQLQNVKGEGALRVDVVEAK